MRSQKVGRPSDEVHTPVALLNIRIWLIKGLKTRTNYCREGREERQGGKTEQGIRSLVRKEEDEDQSSDWTRCDGRNGSEGKTRSDGATDL